MNISFQSLFQAIVLLTLLLVLERLVAPSPAAATTPPPTVPELAELIRAMADGVALSRVEKQLAEISARMDEYAEQFLVLQTATDPQAGRLPQL